MLRPSISLRLQLLQNVGTRRLPPPKPPMSLWLMLAICICCLFPPPAAAQIQASPTSPAAQPNVQIITGEAIRQSGLMRLGDIFRLLDGWSAASLDGFNQQLLPLGAVPGTQSWSLWVDGHRVRMPGYSLQQLSRMPVPLEDIAFVEVSSVPQYQQGEILTGGTIHIRTHQPAPGWNVRGSYWTGNESGDPGPFRFIPREEDAPNVDRLGPDYEGSVAYHNGLWGRAGGISRIQFPTDPAVFPRLAPVMDAFPKRRVLGGYVQARRASNQGENDIWVGVTAADDYVYVRPFAREFPATTLYGQAGWRGTWAFTPAWSARYRATYATNRIGERENGSISIPDWQRDNASAHVDIRRDGVYSRISAGTFVEHEMATSGNGASAGDGAQDPGGPASNGASFDGQRTVIGASAQYRHTEPYGPQPGGALEVRHDGSDWAFTALANAVWHVRPVHVFTGALSYSEKYFADQYDYWYWTRQGAPFLDSVDAALGGPIGEYAFNDVPGKTRLLRGDFRWRLTPIQLLEARMGGFYNWYLDATIEERFLQRPEGGDVYDGPVEVTSGVGGHVIGAFMNVRYRWQPWLTQTLLYQIQKHPFGNEAFLQYLDSQPDLFARTRFTYTPEQSFALDFLFTYQSITDWVAFADGGEETVRVPAYFQADIAATKWFWERRLRAQLVVRNILNESYHSHPVGPDYPLTLYIKLGMAL